MFELVLTKEFLEEQYHKQGKTKTQIAREVGTTVTTLQRYFKLHGVTKNSQALYTGRDLTGERFGRLVVEKRSGVDNHQKSRWYCRCDCGKGCVVNSSSLIRNLTKSCGCYQQELGRANGFRDISASYWRRLREQAVCRGYEFGITMEYVWKIYEKQDGKCSYTGLPVNFSANNNHPHKKTASIDRIDSTLGYTEGNIQIVHKVVNFMKGILRHEEFIAFCTLVTLNHRMSYEDSIEKTARLLVSKV